MKHPRIFRTLAFAIVLGGSIISFTAVAHADCPTGFQNNMDTNVSTGLTIYFCSPLGDQNFAAYDPHITPNAPVAAEEFTPTLAPTPVTAVTPIEAALLAPIDPNDPFPSLAFGEQLPDTIVAGNVAISCPDGAGRGIDINITTGALMSYCVKTYMKPDPSLVVLAVADPTLTTDPTVVAVDPISTLVGISPVKLGGLAGVGVARGD